MSEVTGPSFDPSGTRLYVSSQRAYGLGVVYEISGPFRRQRPPQAPLGADSAPVPAGPAIAVEVPRRRRRTRLLRKGLPVAVTLDRRATVEVRVTARVHRGGRTRTVTVGRLRRRIDAGPEQLRLRIAKTGAKRLRVEVRVGSARVVRHVRVT